METKRKKMKILVAVLAVVLVALAAGGIWFKMTHSIVQREIHQKDTTALTVTSLTKRDVNAMVAMPALREVNANGCRDYDFLMELQARKPGCAVHYTVLIDGTEYPENTTKLTLRSLTEAELALFRYLPDLTAIDAQSCAEYGLLQQLRDLYPGLDVDYDIPIGVGEYPTTSIRVETVGITEEDIAMFQYLPRLKTVHMTNPEMDPEILLSLPEQFPDIRFTWEVEVEGITVDSKDTEVDFSGIPMTSPDAVGKALAYFPDVEMVLMSDCGIDNEVMAAFREEKREEYKVVWTVQCGELAVRTDEIYFMPLKHNIYYFFDEDTYNLRYCEDMVCIDLGHMAITDVSFVEYMPHLKYLILAHTTVIDITPLSTCKELVFLELDWTAIKDYSPLLGCTALEDLNLGLTYGDPEIIAQMTWLKNLWWKGAGYKTRVLLEEKIPDTYLMLNPPYTVGWGWRKLQNYYDMRDILGMEYME